MVKNILFFILICSLPFPCQAAGKNLVDFTTVAEKAIPAVVSIKVQINKPSFGLQDDSEDLMQDDFFRKFFRLPQQNPSRAQVGQGSGFIVSPDGTILTNNHLVKDAEKISVTLNNGKEYVAKVIGKDPNSDLAVIKIDASNLPILKLGNSDAIKVGQWVAAIGNPAGLQATLTVGVVSAKDRSDLGITPFGNFIQTDAAINLGNSGGPLLDDQGNVIGINIAIASHTAGYEGIGFAIPSSTAQQVMEQLLADGSVTRSYLGIILQKVDSDLADAFKLKDMNGALVADVIKDSPASKSKIQPGDIILKLNDTAVTNVGTFRNMVSMMKPGTKLNLTILRDNKEIQTSVETATLPEQLGYTEGKIQKLGIQVDALTQDAAQRLGYIDEVGVVISKVENGSLASMAGLKKGALIVSVNNQSVKTPEEFYNAVKGVEEGSAVVLRVKQEGTTRFISLKSG